MTELQYPTFEANQVLTKDHLNDLREYLRNEDHLTRVHGIGVGILGGLEVTVDRVGDDTSITITCGAGITTGGQLIQIDDCDLTHYREFKDANPHLYELFWTGPPPAQRENIWELRERQVDDKDKPIREFEDDLGSYVVVLYAECREEQIDACNLEDCDDKGADVRITVRKLLVKKELLGQPALPFGGYVPTPLRLERPTSFGQADSFQAISDRYSGLFERMIPYVAENLANTWNAYRDVLADELEGLIVENSTDDGKTQLFNTLQAHRSNSTDEKTQLFFDFLRDIIIAHNAFVACAIELKNWDCADESAFPRHLALSELPPPPKTKRPEYRHEFRPLLATVCQERIVYKMRRLFKKIRLMLERYDPNETAVGRVKIRPQRHVAPSSNAIPYYYKLKPENAKLGELQECWDAEEDPVSALNNKVWTFDEVEQRDVTLDDRDEIERNPLRQNLDDQDFLRVEGHLGQPIDTVLGGLEGLRTTYNLAFDIVALRLEEAGETALSELCDYEEHRARYDRARHDLLWRARQTYDYLYNILFNLRSRECGWLRYVNPSFPAAQTTTVLEALTAWTLTIPPTLEEFQEQPFIRGYFGLMRAMSVLLCALHDYSHDITARAYLSVEWLEEVGKSNCSYSILVALIICQVRGRIMRFFSELDVNLILQAKSWAESARTHLKENDPESFKGFVTLHPGIDHALGTTKPGTLILVHEGNVVKADFYLPYRCCTPPCPKAQLLQLSPFFMFYVESDCRERVEVLNLEVFRETSGRFSKFGGIAIFTRSGIAPLNFRSRRFFPLSEYNYYFELEFPNEVERSWPRLVLHNPEGWAADYLESERGPGLIQLAINDQPPNPTGFDVHLWLYIRPPLFIAGDTTAVTIRGKPVIIDILSNSLIPNNFSTDLTIETTRTEKWTIENAVEEGEDRTPWSRVRFTPAKWFVGRDTFDFEVKGQFAGRDVTSRGRVIVHVTDCCEPEEQPPEVPPEMGDIFVPGHVAEDDTIYFCLGNMKKYTITTAGPVTNVWGDGVFSDTRIFSEEFGFRDVTFRTEQGNWKPVLEKPVAPLPAAPVVVPPPAVVWPPPTPDVAPPPTPPIVVLPETPPDVAPPPTAPEVEPPPTAPDVELPPTAPDVEPPPTAPDVAPPPTFPILPGPTVGGVRLPPTIAGVQPTPISFLRAAPFALDLGRAHTGIVSIGNKNYLLTEKPFDDLLLGQEELPWLTPSSQVRATFCFIPDKAIIAGAVLREIRPTKIFFSVQGEDQPRSKEFLLIPTLPGPFQHELVIRRVTQDWTFIGLRLKYPPPVSVDFGDRELGYSWDVGSVRLQGQIPAQEEVEVELTVPRSQTTISVTLRVWIVDFPECVTVISERIPVPTLQPERLDGVLGDNSLTFREVIETLGGELTTDEAAALETSGRVTSLTRTILASEEGRQKYVDGALDPLILPQETQQLTETADIIREKVRVLREEEAPPSEYEAKVEPLLDFMRAQVSGGLNFAKYKNQPVTPEVRKYVNGVVNTVVELKNAGIDVNAGGKFTRVIEDTKEGIVDESLLDELRRIERVVEER